MLVFLRRACAADQRAADGALARHRRPRDRPPAARPGPSWPPGSVSWSAAGPRWSSRPRRSAAGSSATCTTAPSSGWSRWRCSSAGPGRRFDDRPGGRPRAARRGAQRGQAGAGRAARPGPRAAPGGAHRPRSGRGAVRARRPGADPGAWSRSTRPPAPSRSPVGRGDRLLRGGRGADQRGQARAARPGPRSVRPPARRHAAGRGHRRRRRRRRPGGRHRPARARPTGCPRVDGRLHRRQPAGGPTVAHRGAAMRVVIAEDSVLLREGLARLLDDGRLRGGRGGRRRRAAAAPRSPSTRPDVVVADVRMPPTHTDEGLRAALVIRRAGRRSPCSCSPSTSRSGTPTELLAGDTERRRLPAQGPGRRRGRVRRRAAPGRRPAAPRSTPRSSPSCCARPARDPLDRADRPRAEVLAADGRGPVQRRASPRALSSPRARSRSTSAASSPSSACARRHRPPPGAGRAVLSGRSLEPGRSGQVSGMTVVLTGSETRCPAAASRRGHGVRVGVAGGLVRARPRAGARALAQPAGSGCSAPTPSSRPGLGGTFVRHFGEVGGLPWEPGSAETHRRRARPRPRPRAGGRGGRTWSWKCDDVLDRRPFARGRPGLRRRPSTRCPTSTRPAGPPASRSAGMRCPAYRRWTRPDRPRLPSSRSPSPGRARTDRPELTRQN